MEVLVLIILIGVNAFFAASEIAFISLNDNKIDMEVKEGNKKAKSIQNMLKNPSKFLATIQIGVTFAGFLSSAFASETFASKLSPVLNKLVPAVSLETWQTISIIIITIVLSFFTLVFGELAPKRIGMKYREKIAYGTIGIIKAISVVAAPFVKLLTFTTNIVSKLFGVTESDEEVVTEEEIRMMVDVGEEKGTIGKEEKEMINNVFEFNDRIVSEIMIPRRDIFAFEMNTQIGAAITELAGDARYSRIPIYDGTIDNITGVVYIKDILLSTKTKAAKLKSIAKDVYFVPETKMVNELFKELQKNKKQIAIIIDEYGGTAGLVTMEDILEELVGDIYDEYDAVENSIEQIDDNIYIVDGNTPIYDIEKNLELEIPEGDYDTISGYLMEELGIVPTDEEKLEYETDVAVYKIESYKDKRILKVKITKKIQEENDDNAEEEYEKNDE